MRLLSDDILQVKSLSTANLFLSIQREPEPVKQIYATVKSTIDTYNSSNTVLLFLF